jgi:flagellin
MWPQHKPNQIQGSIMSLVINSNTTATVTRNYLNTNQANLQTSLARLASGSKIISAADDAGGLAVGNKLAATVNRNTRTQQNVQNAISFVQVQDGALAEASKILDRMSELKTMSLDVTKNATDIANYDTEFNQLQTQLGNIKEEKFNGINLFTTGQDDLTAFSVEGGDGLTDSTATQVDTVTINVDATNKASAATYSATVDGVTSTITSIAATDSTAVAALLFAQINIDQTVTHGAANEKVTATAGAAGTITLTASAAGTTFSASGSTTDSTGGINTENTTGKISVQLGREGLFRQDSNGDGLITTDAKDLLDSTAPASDSLSDFSVADFVTFIQNAASTRADNGAVMSRLEASHAMLTTNHANIEAARSRLMDVDIAMESTHFARHNILVQSSAAMLSQANGIPNIALQLLG